MGVMRLYAAIACLCLLMLLAGCGSGAMLDGAAPQTDSSITAAADAAEVAAAAIETAESADIPGIPLDTEGDATRDVSELSGLTVLGKDYILQKNSSVSGDSLVIGGDDARLAFGMYKIGGLGDQRPVSLNVECIPEALDQPYFVGVADYTAGRWHWFGPLNLPEFELDLAGVRHQFVTQLGNMYFLVLTHEGNSATHLKSTLVVGDGPGDGLPGCPHHLIASDGQFPGAVQLEWLGGAGNAGYEIWRKPVFGGGEWQRIGFSMQTNFRDAPLPDWKMFFYRVRSVNPNGESCFSNIDTGFAGGGREPGLIHGSITTPGGEPLGGIPVRLTGAGEELMRRTNEEGKFAFRDLPPGRYLVAPFKPGLTFLPRYHSVNLWERPVAEASFQALRDEIFHRAWGFVFTPAPGDGGDPVDGPRGDGVVPLPNVEVVLRNVADPTRRIVVRTNADGFYLFEDIPFGVWMLTPVSPAFNFIPGPQQITINGMNRPDRHDFIGLPKPPLPGGGGGDDGGGAGDNGDGEGDGDPNAP